MTLDRCIIPNCTAPALWGFGSVLRGTHRSACAPHRHAIWPDVLPPSVGQPEAVAVPPEPATASTIPQQMGLFG